MSQPYDVSQITATSMWKYRLAVTDVQTLSLPKGAIVRSVGVQEGEALNLWAEVDPTETELEYRIIEVRGTGHSIPAVAPHEFRRDFIGTVQMYGGSLVWHVFELVRVEP